MAKLRNKTAWVNNTKEAVARISRHPIWSVEWFSEGELVTHITGLNILTTSGVSQKSSLALSKVLRYFFIKNSVVKNNTSLENSFVSIFVFSPYDILEV